MSTVAPGPRIPNPEISPNLFSEEANGHNFWIGRIASLGAQEGAEVFDAASKLRGNVYLQLGYIVPEQVDSSGRDMDADDERSIHFAVAEKPIDTNGNSNGHANIIGTSRLIVKDTYEHVLPIEHYFPEAFQSEPAKPGTVEVSRLIASHENRTTQYKVALGLIRAMTHYSVSSGVETSYCMVEAPLLRLLNAAGAPTEALAAQKLVPEYAGVLHPVKVEPLKLLEKVRTDVGKAALRRFYLDGIDNHGEGFYGDSFLS